MTRWILALAFVALWIPRPAAAGVLTIDFDLRGSRLSTLVGEPDPPRPVRSGTATLSLTGVDANGRLTDPTAAVTLTGFQLGVTVPFALDTTATLLIDFIQQGSVTLPLIGDGFFDLPVGALTGEVQLRSQQAGGPISPPSSQPFMNVMFTTRFSIAGLEENAILRSNGLISLAFSNQNGPFFIQGVEVARRFVPEPATAGLWSLTLVAFCLSAIGRPRRKLGIAR